MFVMTENELHALLAVGEAVGINTVGELLELMLEWNINNPREIVEIYESGR